MVSRSSDGFDPSTFSTDALLREISSRIAPQKYETWFRHLSISFEVPDRIVILERNRFRRNFIDQNYRELIAECARAVLGLIPHVVIAPEEGTDAEGRGLDRADPQNLEPGHLEPGHFEPGAAPGRESALPGSRGSGRAPAPRSGFRRPGPHSSVPSSSSPSTHGDESPAAEDSSPGSSSPGSASSSRQDSLPCSPINRDFTFLSFVVDSSNRMAHAATLNTAESPGKHYTPLFIHGGVGLGKTHLLHAVVNHLRRSPEIHTTYLTSESFTNHFIRALEDRRADDFRRSLRSTDVLIVDDIQFISSKERPREEFFHTFNALIAEKKQVIISSDCPPSEIVGLEDRLISRFKMGLITKVEPPTLATRIAIVIQKAQARRRDIPPEVASLIAEKIQTNVRELEGAVIRLLNIASLDADLEDPHPSPITLEHARSVLREIENEASGSRSVALADIQRAVAQHYELKSSDLASQRRSQTISLARQICMHLARLLTHHSLEEIGTFLGNRDHSTVHYSIRKVSKLIESNPTLEAEIDRMRRRIQSGLYRS